jgi:hypothetical protein
VRAPPLTGARRRGTPAAAPTRAQRPPGPPPVGAGRRTTCSSAPRSPQSQARTLSRAPQLTSPRLLGRKALAPGPPGAIAEAIQRRVDRRSAAARAPSVSRSLTPPSGSDRPDRDDPAGSAPHLSRRVANRVEASGPGAAIAHRARPRPSLTLTQHRRTCTVTSVHQAPCCRGDHDAQRDGSGENVRDRPG